MGLFIAGILIYQFDMHWGFYVVAVIIALVQFSYVRAFVDEKFRRVLSSQENTTTLLEKIRPVAGSAADRAQYKLL
ncbi:MAG: hypothetical protein IIC59_05735 [Proteobacteria bacterium]|nr:hypothetical protein [Pseudomonadota bacterium]